MANAEQTLQVRIDKALILSALEVQLTAIVAVIRRNVDGPMREALIRDICDELGVEAG